jgi:hypothetical protein
MALYGVKQYDKAIEDLLLQLTVFESKSKEDFIAIFEGMKYIEVMKYAKGVKIMSAEEIENYYQEGYKKNINEQIKKIQKIKEDYIESQIKIINIMEKDGYNKDELIKLL